MSYELNVEEVIAKAIQAIRDNLQTQPAYAEIIAQQLLRTSPNHPDGLQLLGLIKQQNQQYDESIELLSKAIEVNPQNADNYNNIALSYANLNDFDKAIEHLNKAISISPSHLYYNNLALQINI